LSELSGISKGTISKVESGDVIRPEPQTIISLAGALNIPFETMVDYYVQVETRSDQLMRIFEASLAQGGSIEFIRKIASRYLDSTDGDSYELTEKLFQLISSIEDTFIQLSLYGFIIDYSRSHGIMPFIAKGLFQKYMIERYDFRRLKETYDSGKYILNYVDFLPRDQQIELYYRLGIQAYNIRLYHESIEQCKRVPSEDNGTSPYRVHAVGVLRDSYFQLGQYREAERYSFQYKQFYYPDTNEQSILMDALFNAVKGNTDKAIEQLQTFLKTCSDAFILPAANNLMRLYLEKTNTEGIKILLENKKLSSISINVRNPFEYYKYGEYFHLIGEYFSIIGDFDNGINHLLKGAMFFSKINDSCKEKECLNKIMRIHIENNIPIMGPTLEKLSAYFTNEMEG
jgi:transcriptional regulator with XRE-family HTH domain